MAEQTTFDAEQHTNGHSPNGRLTIRELEAGQRVAAVFAVRERDLRQKRNGEPFLRLVLARGIRPGARSARRSSR